METGNNISTRAAAHGVLETLKGRGYGSLTLRPWNRFEPEDSLWWLVPSTEWPSYKHGKLVVYKEKDGFYIGIHVEKGFSPAAAQFSPYRDTESLVIKPDWIWNTALRDMKSGRFAEKLNAISNAVKTPLRISIYTTAVNDKDPDMVRIPGLETLDSISFTFSNGKVDSSGDFAKGRMSEFAYIDSIERLPEMLEAKDMEWFWIDLHVVCKADFPDPVRLGDCAQAFIEGYKELF